MDRRHGAGTLCGHADLGCPLIAGPVEAENCLSTELVLLSLSAIIDMDNALARHWLRITLQGRVITAVNRPRFGIDVE